MADFFSSKFFEVLNGTYFFAFSCLVTIFGRFLIDVWIDVHYLPNRWRRFYRECRPAIAVATVFLGDAMVRGSVWVPRWFLNHHRDADIAMSVSFVTLCAGAMIGLVGAWCVARTYGSRTDGMITVLISLVAGFGFAWPWW